MPLGQELSVIEFDAVLNCLAWGIVGVDEQDRVVIFNRAAEKLLATRAEEAIGRLAKSVIPGLEVQLNKNSNRVNCEWACISNDRKILIREYRFCNLQQSLSYIYTINLIEEEKSRISLNDDKAFSAPAITEKSHLDDVFPEPICEITSKGVIRRENKAWVQFNGRSTLGRNINELRTVIDDDEVFSPLIPSAFQRVRLAQYKNESLVLESVMVQNNTKSFINSKLIWLHSIEQIKTLNRKLFKLTLSEMTLNKQKDFIAINSKMKELMQNLVKASRVDATILITGETGVGKGIIAKKIHELSDRCAYPFVKVNCGAIPETLLESELFGYEKGAFTGARSAGKEGLFEQANNGTIFLDEIGELPLSLQVKLLHFLDDHQIRKVGGSRNIKLDVRIICATNQDLRAMVSARKFRADLFYRLNVVNIKVPPLRERKEDISALITLFSEKYCRRYNKEINFPDNIIQTLQQYHWPGNVRELENTVEHLIALSEHGATIQEKDLPVEIFGGEPIEDKSEFDITLHEALQKLERKMIFRALRKTGSTRKAAELLGVNQATVSRKARKYGIYFEVANSRWGSN